LNETKKQQQKLRVILSEKNKVKEQEQTEGKNRKIENKKKRVAAIKKTLK
jgi:hypothetical protein